MPTPSIDEKHRPKRLSASSTIKFFRAFVAGCLIAGALGGCLSSQTVQGQDFLPFDELMGPIRPDTTPRSTAPPTTLPIPEFDRGSDFNSTPVRPPIRPRSDEPEKSPPSSGTPSNLDFRNFRYRTNDPAPRVDSPGGLTYERPEAERMVPGPGGLAEAPETKQAPFDWSQKVTSAADLMFPASTVFVHNTGFMERKEEIAYLDLITATELQWRRLVQRSLRDREVNRNARAEWEEAFYRFPEVRRLAWENGKLIFGSTTPTLNGLPDPFATATETAVTSSKASGTSKYFLLDDISRFPEHFVGRPIYLYGRFTPESEVKLVPGAQSARTDAERYQDSRTAAAFSTQAELRRNDLNRIDGDDQLPIVAETQKLLRGALIDIDTSQQIAMVDTKGLLTPGNGLLGINDAWRTQTEVPVLVKGWVVKNWKDNRPLIYCESMRLVTPRPHVDLIKKNSVDKRRLQDEETWLYYETLKQMELTSTRLQKEIAAAALQQRIDVLMGDIIDSSKADLAKLTNQFKTGVVTDEVHTRRRAALQRRLDQRLARYKNCRKNPEDFQTYVDMYQHPEAWHGDLVTLRGHVRHVVTYPSDRILFGDDNGTSKDLHELWLFTDDSQHNPAVIITPNLPTDFPKDAEIIDYVTVTGCFFKRYVYGSQDVDRIAPLILASNVTWRPTVDQVQDLVATGLVSAGSPRAVRAAQIAGDRTGQATLWFGAFLVMMAMMVMWGRVQREERDRVHLRKLVNDVPVFENPTVDGYASLLTDIPDDPTSEYLRSTRLPTDKYRP